MDNKKKKSPKESAIQNESARFEEFYTWIEQHMPTSFFKNLEPDHYMLIAHYLMGFHLQEHFCLIELKEMAFVLTLDSPDADVKILEHFNLYGIKNYQTFVSNAPLPFEGIDQKLKIAKVHFTTVDKTLTQEHPLCSEEQKLVYEKIQERRPEITFEEFKSLLSKMNHTFLHHTSIDRLTVALLMFFRAKTRDHCQYEVIYNKDWKEKEGTPSMQLIFAWRNAPKHHFLYRLAKTIHRHNLKITQVNASYVNAYEKNSVLIMSLGLNGITGEAAWDASDLEDFLQEFALLKSFPSEDPIEKTFVDSGLIRGNLGNLLRSMINFIHQTLVHADMHLYRPNNIEESFCKNIALTLHLCKIFELKFHPENHNLKEYEKEKELFLDLISHLDTGDVITDQRRKNVLLQGLNFIDHTLKTTFYRKNKSALCFRLDPSYLLHLPYESKEIFPEIPFSIFFMQGMHFIAFHVRFKDLSRGGLRTVFPSKYDQMIVERNHVFSECYNLAYTQQKKNKDIPEGGSKGVIFLEPYDRLHSEAEIYKKELIDSGETKEKAKEIITQFRSEQRIEYLYQTQRTFVYTLLTLVNCHEDGTLKAKDIVDYFQKPEYIYLGPDENMHNEMIEWIAFYSKHCQYKPGNAFISSKPSAGINHKAYGVTSLGVNVYMEEVLKYLKIDPKKDPFTIKISGGPDGDVAGNQILNLYRFFPKTAKLIALTDGSGTIFDPQGLDLSTLANLFEKGEPIASYPPKKLSEGGFLLDLHSKKEETAYTTKTLCWKKEGGKLQKLFLSGSEMNHLFRHNLHQAKTDIFIPAGGRPKTLNSHNYQEFLDDQGQPTAKAIVEGANLYLTPKGRAALESLGVLIIKDSSANKGGVICSSMEVLSSLSMTKEEFLKDKELLMEQILLIIEQNARDEAKLLLSTHEETGRHLTDISEEISTKINAYTYELLDYLASISFSFDLEDPLIKALFNFCPPLLAKNYKDQILKNIPTIHKKAMIACFIASRLVYKKGLKWNPSIIDVLPLIASDPKITWAPLQYKHSFQIFK